MAKIQINKLSQANVYLNGANLLGRASEITPPKISYIRTDHVPLGLHGKMKLQNGVDAMELKIKWSSYYADVARLHADPRVGLQFQVRGNLETHGGAGLLAEVAVVMDFIARPGEHDPATFKAQDPAMPETTYDVSYYRLRIDGEEIHEIDVFENIYRVEGVDILATMRANIGA